MKKEYETPLFHLNVSTRDVIVMSCDVAIDLSETDWGDFDEGGLK